MISNYSILPVVGQTVNYGNGTHSVYNGTVVEIKGQYLVVIDCEAGIALYNAGFAVGSYIHVSQLVK